MLDAEKWHQIFSGVIISGCDEDLYAHGNNFSGSGLSLTSDLLTCICCAAGCGLLFLLGAGISLFQSIKQLMLSNSKGKTGLVALWNIEPLGKLTAEQILKHSIRRLIICSQLTLRYSTASRSVIMLSRRSEVAEWIRLHGRVIGNPVNKSHLNHSEH